MESCGISMVIVLDFFGLTKKPLFMLLSKNISSVLSGDWVWNKTRHLFASMVSGLCPRKIPVQPVDDTSNRDNKKIVTGKKEVKKLTTLHACDLESRGCEWTNWNIYIYIYIQYYIYVNDMDNAISPATTCQTCILQPTDSRGPSYTEMPCLIDLTST